MDKSERGWTFEQAVDLLRSELPLLRTAVDSQESYWADANPQSYAIYEAVLVPYLQGLIDSGDAQQLTKVFSFVERLVSVADEKLDSLVAVTVGDFVLADRRRLRIAGRYMGERTKRLLKEYAKARR
jgi:hypothetical protein